MNKEQQQLPLEFGQRVELVIPAFDTRPPIRLSFKNISEGEKRIIEARAVNGATYSDLEYSFNEGYREAKVNLTTIGYEITQAEKRMREVKSQLLLDEYPAFLKEKSLKDNAEIRNAFLETNQDYKNAQDRIDMLRAIENLMEGKIKVFENVCRFMRKEIDILLRSGMVGNKYTS